jgi:hypothetical protein
VEEAKLAAGEERCCHVDLFSAGGDHDDPAVDIDIKECALTMP